MQTFALAAIARKGRKRRPIWPALVLVFCTGCSSALDNGKRVRAGDDGSRPGDGQGQLRFPDEDMAAKYKAAKASPQSFEPVIEYARAVALFCLASLVDTSCTSCDSTMPTYRPRSELSTNYWPIIEDVLPMLDPFMNGKGLDADRIEGLVEVKGRLLWLAGRSLEEQTLVDGYALAHPAAVTIVKRRLELLREAGDVPLSESQCLRSRARTKTAAESIRLDLLTSCVALHPHNSEGKSQVLDYATYLPNLSPDEDGLYRNYLAERCAEKAGDEAARCAESCACEEKDASKRQSATCRSECGACRKVAASHLELCNGLRTPAATHATRAARAKVARAGRGKPGTP